MYNSGGCVVSVNCWASKDLQLPSRQIANILSEHTKIKYIDNYSHLWSTQEDQSTRLFSPHVDPQLQLARSHGGQKLWDIQFGFRFSML